MPDRGPIPKEKVKSPEVLSMYVHYGLFSLSINGVFEVLSMRQYPNIISSSCHNIMSSNNELMMSLPQVNLRVLLVSGKTHDFLFDPSICGAEMGKHIFHNWPSGTHCWKQDVGSRVSDTGRGKEESTSLAIPFGCSICVTSHVYVVVLASLINSPYTQLHSDKSVPICMGTSPMDPFPALQMMM